VDGEFPTYEELQQWLERSGSHCDAAEAHGMLCGYAVGGAGFRPADWRSYLGPEPAAGDGAEWDARLERLYRGLREGLADPELGFSPLLPGDGTGVAARAAALGRWVQGFLLGLGLGGVRRSQLEHGDAAEVMRDLAALSRAGDYAAEEGEESERAYAELLEFLRTAVLLLREEVRHAPGQEQDAPPRDRSGNGGGGREAEDEG